MFMQPGATKMLARKLSLAQVLEQQFIKKDSLVEAYVR
jgi:hypothetical protein